MNKKIGLVLAGGGSRGAYQLGVWKALCEMGYKIDIITGTSVGALNGAFFASGQYQLAEKMWEAISTDLILECNLKIDMTTPELQRKSIESLVGEAIKQKSIDQMPLKNLLIEIFDKDEFFKSSIDFGTVVVKYPSLKHSYVTKKEISKSNIIDYLMATSACFPAMKPYEIQSETYIDGGYYDNLPINLAVKMGAEEIIAVDLKAIGISQTIKNSSIPITKISPTADLGFIMIFDKTIAKKIIDIGYFDAMKAYARLDGYKFTFEKGTYNILQNDFSTLLRELITITDNQIFLKMMSTKNILTEKIEKAIKQQNKAYGIKTSNLHNSLIACAEAAGETFELKKSPIYCAMTFNSNLKLSLICAQREAELKKIDPMEMLNGLNDAKTAITILYKQIDEMMKTKKLSFQFVALSQIFPSQTLGAIFLYLINAH